jgi:organic hydroperoxide reductase OsmC/OhrA
VCDAEGTVDRVDGAMRFTGIRLRARLVLPAGEDPAKGCRIVEKAEKTCLVANSLKFEPELEVDVAVE